MTIDFTLTLLFSAVSLLALLPPASESVDTSQGTLGSQHRSDPLLPERVQHSPTSPLWLHVAALEQVPASPLLLSPFEWHSYFFALPLL